MATAKQRGRESKQHNQINSNKKLGFCQCPLPPFSKLSQNILVLQLPIKPIKFVRSLILSVGSRMAYTDVGPAENWYFSLVFKHILKKLETNLDKIGWPVSLRVNMRIMFRYPLDWWLFIVFSYGYIKCSITEGLNTSSFSLKPLLGIYLTQ